MTYKPYVTNVDDALKVTACAACGATATGAGWVRGIIGGVIVLCTCLAFDRFVLYLQALWGAKWRVK